MSPLVRRGRCCRDRDPLVRLDEEAGPFDGLEDFGRGGGRLEGALFRRDACPGSAFTQQAGDRRVTRLDGQIDRAAEM